MSARSYSRIATGVVKIVAREFCNMQGQIVFRRKEYILLTAVGMSRKTLFRMVIFESIVYFFESIVTLILILYLSIGALAVFAGRNVMGYINVPYFIIVILVHLLVVVGTTAIGLSTTMTDDVVEGIRKEYY